MLHGLTGLARSWDIEVTTDWPHYREVAINREMIRKKLEFYENHFFRQGLVSHHI